MVRNLSKRIVRLLISLMIIFSIFLISTNVNAKAKPELKIDSELRYLFDQGGGEITITVSGFLASELRRDIFEDYLFKKNTTISQTTQDDFGEAIEDILERDIKTFIDKSPKDAGVDYNGVYKIIELDRVDIKSIDGLLGKKMNDTSDIKIKMDIKGPVVEDSDVILSDGYIILYALWGDEDVELLTEDVDVSENTKITTIRMNSYSDFKLDSGGKITHYRLIMGEHLEYTHEYKLTGYEIDGKKDTVHFDSFNVMQNSLGLFLIILILAIIASLIASSFAKKKNVKKVVHLRVLGFVFFILLMVVYFLGIDGVIIWGVTILFFVVNFVLSFGVYQKGWGNLVHLTIRHEDFMKAPPKIEQGPWHERGIANAKVGNFLEAVNCFENALEAEPDNAIIWNDLGFVLRKLGNYRQAVDCFKKAISLRPDYPTAVDNLEKAMIELESAGSKRK